MKNDKLHAEQERASEMLKGKTVAKVYRHRKSEVAIIFSDGTRLFIDTSKNEIELSITN